MNINKINLIYSTIVHPNDFLINPTIVHPNNLGSSDKYLNTKKEIEDNYINEEKVPEEGQKKKWLVILYSAGDNNLASFLHEDINELESVGSDESTHIVTIADQGKQWNAAFKGAKVFYLKKDNNMSKINSPLLKNLGQVNTADPKFMASSIAEIIKKFPAEHIAIIIGDHGLGWEGAIEDNTHDKFMSLPEIREALEEIYQKTGKRIDVLAFDACLMAMAEVGYELKNAVKYLVASEETEGGKGYSYNIIFSKAIKDAVSKIQQAALFKVNVDPEEFAKIIVESAKEYSDDVETISAVDLDKVNDLVSKLDEFAKLVISKTKDSNLYDYFKILKETSSTLNDISNYKNLDTNDLQKIIEELDKYKALIDSLSKALGTQNNNNLNNIDYKSLLNQLGEVKNKLNDLLAKSQLSLDSKKIEEFLNELSSPKQDIQKLKEKIRQTQSFSIGSFRDLYHFAKLIYEDNSISQDLRNKAKEIMDALNKYIVNEFSNDKYKNAYGVSVELPSYGNVDSKYKNTQFAKNTSWDEMLEKLNKA
jgi:hypothetical protein